MEVVPVRKGGEPGLEATVVRAVVEAVATVGVTVDLSAGVEAAVFRRVEVGAEVSALMDHLIAVVALIRTRTEVEVPMRDARNEVEVGVMMVMMKGVLGRKRAEVCPLRTTAKENRQILPPKTNVLFLLLNL